MKKIIRNGLPGVAHKPSVLWVRHDSCTNDVSWHYTSDLINTSLQLVQVGMSPLAGNFLRSLLQLVVQ